MEELRFPMNVLRVTQGAGSGSHNGSRAVDFGGADQGCDAVYAPFSGVVKRTRKNANGEMYIWSDEKVLFANGIVDYATVTLIHDSSFNLPEGAHFKQGDHIYDEGGMGSGRPNAFGNHLHMEVSRGHVACSQRTNGYKFNGKPVYVTPGQCNIAEVMFLGPDVIVKNTGGYTWKRSGGAAQTPAPSVPTQPPTVNNSTAKKAGDVVVLNGKPLYTTSSATTGKVRAGTFYLYDNSSVNGRRRVTNLPSRVGKSPAAMNVSGWVQESDI